MGVSPEHSQGQLVEAPAEAEWTCLATGGAGFRFEREALVETDWTCSATRGAGFDAELEALVEADWTCSATRGAGFGAELKGRVETDWTSSAAGGADIGTEFEALGEADFSAKPCPHGVTLPLVQLFVSLASSSVALLCILEKYTKVAHRPTLCLHGRQPTLDFALQVMSSLNCL